MKSVTSMGSQCSNKTCRFGSFGSALQKLKRQHLGAAGVMKALLFHVHNWFGISKLLQAGGEMARGRKSNKEISTVGILGENADSGLQ